MTKNQNFNSMPERFDPFSDRRSRDIRNHLSQIFVRAVSTMDSAPFIDAVDDLLKEQHHDIYRTFILNRLKRYQKAFEIIHESKVKDPLHQAFILWNNELFFEVHELLEDLWHPSKGEMRQALKGLIQAAGVYIHLERKNQKAAKALAQRALVHLEKTACNTLLIHNTTTLIQKLKVLDHIPPKLNYNSCS